MLASRLAFGAEWPRWRGCNVSLADRWTASSCRIVREEIQEGVSSRSKTSPSSASAGGRRIAGSITRR